MSNPRFAEVRAEASEALLAEDLRSVYVGLVHESGDNEYYFGNDTGEAAELRETAAVQLGMLTRVLADRSELSVEEVTDLAAERAAEMRLSR
jgi:hypothetical protein